MADTTTFDAALVDDSFGPDEGLGALVVGFDESIDVLPELRDGGEGSAMQGLSFQDREPDFHLIEPGGSRWGEVEMHVRVTLGGQCRLRWRPVDSFFPVLLF